VEDGDAEAAVGVDVGVPEGLEEFEVCKQGTAVNTIASKFFEVESLKSGGNEETTRLGENKGSSWGRSSWP